MFLRTLEAVAATDTTLANSLCNRETTGLDLHFRPGMGENEGVAAVEPAASDSPPDCRIKWVRVRCLISTKKKNPSIRTGFFLVETTGLEPVTSCV